MYLGNPYGYSLVPLDNIATCNDISFLQRQITDLQNSGGTTPTTATVETLTDSVHDYSLRFSDGENNFDTCCLKPKYPHYHFDLSTDNAHAQILVGNVTFDYYGKENGTGLQFTLRNISGYDFNVDLNVMGTDGHSLTETGSQYQAQRVRTGASHDRKVIGNAIGRHSVYLKQQQPDTNIWSLCEVKCFPTDNNKHVDIWVDWIAENIEYEVK